MRIPVYIVDERPHEEGVEEGKTLGAQKLRDQTRLLREDPLLKPTCGQMSDAELDELLQQRMQTKPDDGSFPELAELHPEVIDRLKGKAEGAGVSLPELARHDYLTYRRHQIHWWKMYQSPPLEDAQPPTGCSGVILVGDEIWLGKNVDSTPIEYAKPKVNGEVHREKASHRLRGPTRRH